MPSPQTKPRRIVALLLALGLLYAGRKLDSWPPLCQFVLNAQGPLSLYVSDDSGATGREDYDRKRSLSAATEAVSGIGDQAYWQADIAQFHVMLGDTHVFVGFGGTPTPAGAITLPAEPVTEDVVEIRVPVLDRPGVLAEVTTLAGELDVNIYDFEIAHSAEGDRGVLLVVVPAESADLVRGGLLARGYRPSVQRVG